MVTKYYRGQELLETSDRELDRQREPIRASLNHVGIPGEDWLVDFLLILRSVRRNESELDRRWSTKFFGGATTYADLFEVENVETVNSTNVATQPTTSVERDAWNPLRYFTEDQSDLVDLVVRLESIRRSSVETVTRLGISLNMPPYRLRTLDLYLDWCISTHQSVLHTLLKFDLFALDDRLRLEPQLIRMNQFQLFRGIMLKRLLDGTYLSFNDYVKAASEGTLSIDAIEKSLSHYVGSKSVLDDFIRDLRIVSR